MKGRFITVEGVEGAGKTTVLDSVCEELETRAIPTLRTREPGGTMIGESIRRLLLDPDNAGMHAQCELLLMFAARAQHVHEVIAPALEQGTWVLCDRFTDATYAYQGGGRGLDEKAIGWLERWVQEDLQPHLTIYLDVPADVGLARAGNRSDPDRFEAERVAFFERVRERYVKQAASEPGRFRVVDATRSLDAVVAEVKEITARFIEADRP